MARPPNKGPDGPTIRRFRNEHGLTQIGFVKLLRAAAEELGLEDPGVTVQMVSRWENGKSGLGVRNTQLVEHVFARTMKRDDDSFDAVNRRAFLLGSTATMSLALVNTIGAEPWQRLAATISGRSRLDPATIDGLRALNVSLSQMFQPVAPRLLLGPVRSHVETINNLLNDSALTRSIRQQLTSLAAEMAILVGWLSKEDGDEIAAQGCFSAALTAAVEAGNNDLGAYAVASASTLGAFRSSPQQSLGLLTSSNVRGAELGKANTSTRIWMACLEAEVSTRVGDESNAFQALDRADSLLDELDPSDSPRPILGHFDSASLMGERGVTAVRLNLTHDAQPALDAALDQLTDYPKTRSRILTNAAKAHLQRGDIEQAASTALGSLNVARQTGSGVGVDDVRKLRQDMERWANSESVQELDQQLALPI